MSPNASAASTYGSPALRLSLQGTRHHLNNFIAELLAATSKQRHGIYRTLLLVIVHKTVPERLGRSEARVRKRRPLILPFNDQTGRTNYENNCNRA